MSERTHLCVCTSVHLYAPHRDDLYNTYTTAGVLTKPYDILYIISHGNRQLVVMRERAFAHQQFH